MGDAVTILPSGRETTIASIVTFDGNVKEADAGQAVTLTLAQEIDLSRGDFIVASQNLPLRSHAVKATVVWLNEKPADLGKRYRIKHAIANGLGDAAEFRLPTEYQHDGAGSRSDVGDEFDWASDARDGAHPLF